MYITVPQGVFNQTNIASPKLILINTQGKNIHTKSDYPAWRGSFTCIKNFRVFILKQTLSNLTCMGLLMPIIPQRVAPRYILPPGCLDFKAQIPCNSLK